MNLEKLFDEQFELSNCSSDKQRMDILNEKISDFESIINQMRILKNKYRQNIIESWKVDLKNRYPFLKECNFDGKFVGVDVKFYGKIIHVFVHYDSTGLYCQVEYDRNLPKEERMIANTHVMDLKDILTNRPNQDCIWKYFNIDDVDGVYNCFLEVIKRCINKQDSLA